MALEPGIYRDVPFSEYLADPCATPSLSSSTAKTILERSPLHAFYEHPRLGGGARAATEQERARMDRGTVIHALLLDGGQDFEPVNAEDWRGKAARLERDRILGAGKIPILLHQLAACRLVADRLEGLIPRAPAAQHEVTAVWLSEGAVLCRGRLDALVPSEALVVDLKTTENAADAVAGRAIFAAGRDLEAASRLDALDALFPDLAGRWRFEYVFAECVEPYAVVRAELAGDFLELGRRRWRRAVETWAACLESGDWPGPYHGRARIEAPAWALAADLEAELRLARGLARNSNETLGL